MSRYIDVDTLIVDINKSIFNADDKEWYLTLLANAPNIDIVRCGECRWCDDVGKKRALICTNPYIDVDPNPNFFCGYGERREP